jgi:hypothetical protein
MQMVKDLCDPRKLKEHRRPHEDVLMDTSKALRIVRGRHEKRRCDLDRHYRRFLDDRHSVLEPSLT